ncbi:hypothetical protein D3C78_1929230 [compost metagenome]
MFYAIRTRQRLTPYIVDLAALTCDERIATHENPDDWPFDDLESLWRARAPSEQPETA